MNERRKFSKTRVGETTKIEVQTGKDEKIDVYITVNFFEVTREAGEVFVRIRGDETQWLDQFCRAVSVLLQMGVSTRKLDELFAHCRYKPNGLTTCPDVREAKSLTDLIVRFIHARYPSKEE